MTADEIREVREAAQAKLTHGCPGCGGPLTVRMVGVDRDYQAVICESPSCWPAIPDTWRKEIAITGFVREYGARLRLRRAS